jgi:hypothetical protein
MKIYTKCKLHRDRGPPFGEGIGGWQADKRKLAFKHIKMGGLTEKVKAEARAENSDHDDGS